MQATQKTFISSTFWTERIGPSAALKTLEVMKREVSWEKITKTGIEITDRWKKLANKYGLKMNTWGMPALCGFTLDCDNQLSYKTLITQEMLKRNYLASNIVFVSVLHTKVHIDNYLKVLDSVFKKISMQVKTKSNPKKLIDDKISRASFKRLN